MANPDPSKGTTKPKKIFVIAPIGKLDQDGTDFSKLCLEEIIKPAAKDCGGYAVPVRADEHHKPGSIAGKVVTSILDADVCIADLTDRNANVMYEVAIAHAADKPVILLQQEDGGPPFDFADERVIHYGLRVDEANAARAQLVAHLKAAHDDEKDERLSATMNPVRVLFSQLKATAQASAPEKAVLAELQNLRDDLRRLRREADREPTLTERARMALLDRDPRGDGDLDYMLVMVGRDLVAHDKLDPEALEMLDQRVHLASTDQKRRLLALFSDMADSPIPRRQAQVQADRLIRDIVPF